jgi:hypothetical protein
MAIPEAKLKIEDGALGAIAPNTAGASVKIGVCSAGTPNTVTGFSDVNAAKAALGQGPLVEALAQVLSIAGGPVYAVPVTASTAGTVGSVTKTGPGTGTITPSIGPDRIVRAKISTGGTLGTMQVQFSVDNGAYGSPIVSNASAPWAQSVAGTLVKLSFPAGTYVANDVYTANLNGTVSLVGTSPAGVTQASSPVDAYEVRIQIATAGGLGVGAFVYSTDGGNTVSPVIAIPGGGVYSIPGTGVVLTFAGTFTAGDLYTFTTTAAGFSNSDVTAALDAVLASPLEWGFVHIVGTPASAAASASLAAVLDSKLTTAETNFRYAFGVAECPQTESDSTIMAAFASFESRRTMVTVGDVGMVSVLTGKINRRNLAWSATARIARIPISDDPAWVALGALRNVTKLYRDEASTPGLDETRFTTARTHIGRAGYYLTNGRTMAPGGSDYTYVQFRRVMDRACQVVRAGILPFLNSSVRIDDAGKIDERDAKQIESMVNGMLDTALVSPGYVSASEVVVDRSANILSGATLPVTVRVRPKGYAKQIEVSMGFTNPALAAAA